MRKVIMWNMVTLDGFFERPKPWEIDWHEYAWGDELEQFGLDQTKSAGTLLFGRVTYEGMAAYWMTALGKTAAFMNSVPKIVFSKTLERADWNNSRLVRSSAEEEVAKLKQQTAEKDMFIFGSATLSSALTRSGLIDEYRRRNPSLPTRLASFDTPTNSRSPAEQRWALPEKIQTSGKERDEGSRLAAGRQEPVHERGRADLVVRELHHDVEVFQLEIVGERMLRIVPGRDALERVPLNGEAGAHASPFGGALHDPLPNELQAVSIRVPQTSTRKGLPRRQVEIETRRMSVAAALHVWKMGADVGLVRALVLREPHVAVNAEHRSADGPRVGSEVGIDGLQRLGEVADEAQDRRFDIPFVALFVGLEPVPAVVTLEFGQKPKEI
jgi:dihydrofolate reductase